MLAVQRGRAGPVPPRGGRSRVGLGVGALADSDTPSGGLGGHAVAELALAVVEQRGDLAAVVRHRVVGAGQAGGPVARVDVARRVVGLGGAAHPVAQGVGH